MAIPFLYQPAMARYDFGDHPFRAENVADLRRALEDRIAEGALAEEAPPPATDGDLLTVHDPRYVARVHGLEATEGYLSPDTWVAKGTPDAALAIVGGAMRAVDLALGGETTVLCPGGFHHAGRDYGEGFCLFNDVATAAERAVRKGLERVLVLDTDAHQGNGTMDIFWERRDVLFISLHQDPRTLYPGRGYVGEIGSGAGKGFTVNVPMFPYSGDGLYREAFDRVVEPVAEQFRPQLVIRNGGSDPHFRDELTMLGMTMDGLRMFGERAARIASAAEAPLVDLPISGYGAHAVPGWLQIWTGATGIDMAIPFEEGLRRIPPTIPERSIAEHVRATLDALEEALSPHWAL